jgi:hypothetical protein
MKTLLILGLLAVIGCGTNTPFKRGEPREGGENPVSGASAGLNESDFSSRIFPLLDRDCTGCHGNPAPSFEAAKSRVVFRNLNESQLYMRASGKEEHETIWTDESDELKALVAWIMGKSL